MSAFKRSGILSIYVPTRNGRPVQRSTSTRDGRIARNMKRMVQAFKDEHRWALLAAIEAKKLTLSRAYTFHVANRLAELEAQLAAKNLSDSLDGWIKWVRSNRDEDVKTADVYWQQVTTLVPVEGAQFLATDLTKERVIAWLTSRENASSGTRRKYLYALRSFVSYLVDTGVLVTNPLSGLKAPKKNPARRRWVTADVDETIVANAIPEYTAFFAFVKGIGCDVGSARRAQKGDVNLFGGKVDVRGTKTNRRAVHQATIEPWALPYIKAHIKTLKNADRHALLFPDITNSGASHHHQRVCETLNVADYTLKDARHSIGVRMRLARKTFEDIASQLGTSVFQVVTVYSVYTPDEEAPAQEEAK